MKQGHRRVGLLISCRIRFTSPYTRLYVAPSIQYTLLLAQLDRILSRLRL